MTQADKIMAMLGEGVEPEAIAERLGCRLVAIRRARFYTSPKGKAWRQRWNAERRRRRAAR